MVVRYVCSTCRESAVRATEVQQLKAAGVDSRFFVCHPPVGTPRRCLHCFIGPSRLFGT